MNVESLKLYHDSQFIVSALGTYDFVPDLVKTVWEHHQEHVYFYNQLLDNYQQVLDKSYQMKKTIMSVSHELKNAKFNLEKNIPTLPYPVDLKDLNLVSSSNPAIFKDYLCLLEQLPDSSNIKRKLILEALKENENHYSFHQTYRAEYKSRYPLTVAEATKITQKCWDLQMNTREDHDFFASSKDFIEYKFTQLSESNYDWMKGYNAGAHLINKLKSQKTPEVQAQSVKIAQRIFNQSQYKLLEWTRSDDLKRLPKLLEEREHIYKMLKSFVGHDFDICIDEDFISEINYHKKNRRTKESVEKIFDNFPLNLIEHFEPPKTKSVARIAEYEKELLNLRMSYQPQTQAKTNKFKL